MFLRVFLAIFLVTGGFARAQQSQTDVGASAEPENKSSNRIFGIIPSFKSSDSLDHYAPLTARQKFKIAEDDAFDRGTVVLGALFGAQAMLQKSNPSFGQGTAGYFHYFGTAYGDFVIGDLMTEGVYPTLLHQDPRYFRKAVGSRRSRLVYAMGQIFLTRGDSGRTEFNFSEIAGNATAVAISNFYYPENRNAADAVQKLGMQIGVDMAANILREFWPDVNRKLARMRHRNP
jgi:hypothetical protein